MGPIWEQTGGVVASGPFAGLRYLKAFGKSHFTQKVLGTYEKELAPTLGRICSRSYQVVVNLGAGEGYYACGLAMRLPGARVEAYELQVGLHPVIVRIARLNELEARLDVKGGGTLEHLASAVKPDRKTLVVCDVEGAEQELLDPTGGPGLLTADLLVEIHHDVDPGIAGLLEARFGKTHAIQSVQPTPRTVSDLPESVQLEPELALLAMDEMRTPGNFWMWLEARLSG